MSPIIALIPLLFVNSLLTGPALRSAAPFETDVARVLFRPRAEFIEADAARPEGPALEAVPVRIDVTHSTLGFLVRHFGVTKIRGVFNQWSGSIMYNENDLTKSSLAVVVQTASIDTRHQRRDGDLTGENFFDSEQYPVIVLRSTSIERDGDGYVIHADLTIREITKQVTIPFEFLGIQEVRGRRIFAAGSFSIKRSEFDLARENRLARVLGVVSDEVQFELDIQGVITEAEFSSRRRPSIGAAMLEAIESDGVDAALELYRSVTTSGSNEYNTSGREIVVLLSKLSAAEQDETADAVFDFMVEESPSPALYLYLATMLADHGDHAAAMAEVDKALELDPHDTAALAMKGLMH